MAQTLYQQLQAHEIRVLTVLPGDVGDPLICRLETCDMAHGLLSYEALSYAWGDESQRDSVTVNGHALDITASAARALRTIRLRSDPRGVFIDYVCINQQDLAERGSQVALMSQIYEKSRRTLAILGEDSEMGRAAFSAIEEVAHEADCVVAEQKRTLGDILFANDGYWAFAEEPLACSPDLPSLSWLYQRPWFRRVWVLQEAILGPECLAIIGDASLDLGRILTATAWLEHKSMVLGGYRGRLVGLPGFRGAQNMWLIRRNIETKRHPLNALLCMAPFGQTKDVRDQVFGLLGLYHRMTQVVELPSALTPDYGRDASEVLRAVTRHAIDEQRNLNILQRSPPKGGFRPANLPTWVTEWYREHELDDARALSYECRACGAEPSWISVDQPTTDLNILSLKGLFLDLADHVTPPQNCSVACEETFRAHFQSIESIALGASASVEAIGATIVGGEWINGRRVTSEQALLWTELSGHMDEDAAYSPDIPVSEFRIAFHNASMNRCFFSTEAGLIGIGPSDMRSGDVVAILQGGTLPFVLRRKGEEYTFQGPAYVHGIMHGEAIEQHLLSKSREQDEEVSKLWRGKTKPKEMIFHIV